MALVPVSIAAVPMVAARAWLSAAQHTVDLLRSDPHDVPGEVIDAFQGYLDVWSDSVDDGETFTWTGRVDDAEVQRVGLHWARIVTITRSGNAGGLAPADPIAAPFYDALATGIVNALAAGPDVEISPEAFSDVVPAFDAVLTVRRAPTPARVVIVDDSSDIRLLLRMSLAREAGIDVVGEAADGRVGVEVVNSLRPDVVVLDVEMPVMGGLEALRSIRRDAPATKVVMFSASIGAQCKALESGAFAYVSKAESVSELCRAILAAAETTGAGMNGAEERRKVGGAR